MTKTYRDPPQARIEDQHPIYAEWMKQNKYYKKLLDDACVKIADLTLENKKLKYELSQATLPRGRFNKEI